MIFTFEISYDCASHGEEHWEPITITNPDILAGFLGPKSTIRNFKIHGE